MRWGRWYQHDAESIVHSKLGVVITLDDLWTPTAVVAKLLAVAKDGIVLSVEDAAHLLIAANQLCWQAFPMQGLGDWCDKRGRQQGAMLELRSAGG